MPACWVQPIRSYNSKSLAYFSSSAARDAAGPGRLDRLKLELLKPANILGDRQQLEQLVRNLVDNALKYGTPDTPVTVELARSQDDQARITVCDEGEGIAPDQIPHLTRRFYRTDPGRSRASGGTGLGLAIVKHIVERHRGRLDIESELGKGTKVIVRLPVADDEIVEPDKDGDTTTTLAQAAEAGGVSEDSPEQELS